MFNLPVVHALPVYPVLHVHVNPLTEFWQVPCWHELGLQSIKKLKLTEFVFKS